MQQSFEKPNGGSGRNKVSIIYNAHWFKILSMVGSLFPERDPVGKLIKYDN